MEHSMDFEMDWSMDEAKRKDQDLLMVNKMELGISMEKMSVMWKVRQLVPHLRKGMSGKISNLVFRFLLPLLQLEPSDYSDGVLLSWMKRPTSHYS